MSWKYFACVGVECDPVEASASRNPEKTMGWVEREIRKAERGLAPWICRIYRVSTDMKAEAVAHYAKPLGESKVKVLYYLESL